MMPSGLSPIASNPAIETAYRHGIVSDKLANVDPNLRGTLSIKLPGVDGVVKFGDWRWYRVWNRVYFVEGDTEEKLFFANGIGQRISGGTRNVTKVDTNQPRSGDTGLPTDWAAYIYQPKLSVVEVAGTDGDVDSPGAFDAGSLDTAQPNDRILFEVERKVFFQLEANDKMRQNGHFIDYPRGGGINNAGNQTMGFNQPTNGIPSPRDAHQLVVPVQFDANQNFQMRATPVAAMALDQAQQVNDHLNTSILVQCDLEGLYKVKVV